MGKNVYLPGLALLSGILGLGLRLWQRRVSFDPETLLFLSGCPAPALLLALTAGVVINRVYERLTPSEKHGGCAADGEGLLP